MRRALLCIALAVPLLAAGCVDDTAPAGPDAAPPDAEPDAFVPPPLDAEPDRGPGGVFGEPCEADADCASGYCVEARDFGRLCTRTCGECPAGFECAPIGNAGPDRTFVCLVDQPDVCKPCETDRECDDPADLCLPIGRRTYCGEHCTADADCPDGFACAAFARGDDTVTQCAPADGLGCQPCRDADGDGHGMGADCLDFDCDDTDDAIHPGAPERCNGLDDDCDSVPDEMPSDSPPGECLSDGICRGSRAICDGGGWRCDYPDGWSEAGEVRCDGIDEDCDGAVDEDYDFDRDPAHCGRCGNDCAAPNGEGACLDGACALLGCDPGFFDIDRDPRNGCEAECPPPVPERCNGVDEDCDGRVDEGYDLDRDPSNCGACGRRCDPPNAVARCAAGECALDACLGGWLDLDADPRNGCEYACQPTRDGIEVCDLIDNDCNGIVDDGIDLTSDADHCGRCDAACPRVPNRAVACVDAVCAVGDCLPGFVDANGQAADGCEYACVARGAEQCDGADDDCDTRVDEGVQNACGGCGPVPAEACNGADDDCDGAIDEGSTCGAYIAARCRLFVGWADARGGPNGASPTWDNCPRVDRDLAGPVRCTGTRRDGRFARIQTAGDVNDDDQFAAALLCDDAAQPAVAAYIQSRCALFWGHADRAGGPDGSPTWGPCPDAISGDNGALRCTSSGFDGSFRSFVTVGDVNEDDDFGFAWICRDPADPRRAAALQSAAAVYAGWADREAGAPDGSATWGPCPAAASGELGAQRCTSTRGDGRFHRMRLGGDVNEDDQFGFALRAR